MSRKEQIRFYALFSPLFIVVMGAAIAYRTRDDHPEIFLGGWIVFSLIFLPAMAAYAVRSSDERKASRFHNEATDR